MADGRQSAADYELEVWARTVLVGSRRPGPYDKVRAYRVLARTNPGAYAAHLARALVGLSWEAGYRKAPQARLALLEEAVAAARAVPDDEPGRAELVVDVLDWYQRPLYERGRRADGLAVREEMAAVARAGIAAGEEGRVTVGLRVWALGLAEEGRHDEAAAVLAELVEATPSAKLWGTDVWDRFSLTAALDAAGRTDEAVAVLGALVEERRVELRTAATSLGGVFLMLVWYALLLDRAGRRQDADAARAEALALLRRLADTGEPRQWTGAQYTVAGVLIAAQARDGEPDGLPRPAFGTDPGDWSADLRARYFDETEGPGTLSAAVRRETRPRELAALRRRLAVRAATYRLWRHGHTFLDPTLPFLDDSVAAARRVHADGGEGSRTVLVGALTDRAMVLVAGHRYPDALTDYAEALSL